MDRVKYKQLTDTDRDILSTPSFLNDDIIEFYFTYLAATMDADDILFVPPAVSELLAIADDVDVVKGSVEPLALDTKNLIFFAVNDCNHWSLMVYDRKLNEFLHHDSMEGANNMQATKLYDALKYFVVPAKLSGNGGKETVKPKKLNRSKKSSVVSKSAPSPTTPPSFKECPTPQQTNGYDCGLFVLSIAKAICEWHCIKKNSKVNYWFNEKQVNPSVVECSMRSDIMNLIKELSL